MNGYWLQFALRASPLELPSPGFFSACDLVPKQGGYFEYKPIYWTRLPIIKVDPADAAGLTLMGEIEQKARDLLSSNARIRPTRIAVESADLRRMVQGLERPIDKEVYKLYGLTTEEIELIGTLTAI